MRYCIEPVGFPVTKMRKGNWNHPRIFSDYGKMKSFAHTWFTETLEYEGSYFDCGRAISRDQVESMIADEECIDPVVALMKNRITPDFTELWFCIKGWFLIREFE